MCGEKGKERIRDTATNITQEKNRKSENLQIFIKIFGVLVTELLSDDFNSKITLDNSANMRPPNFTQRTKRGTRQKAIEDTFAAIAMPQNKLARKILFTKSRLFLLF